MLHDLAGIGGSENSSGCEDGLRLWQRMLKLRWLRLDGEAESVAT